MKWLSEKHYSSQDLECIFLLLSMSVTRIQVKNSKNNIYIYVNLSIKAQGITSHHSMQWYQHTCTFLLNFFGIYLTLTEYKDKIWEKN